MTGHRPLSDWVATVVRESDGTARRVPGVTLNDGDERADARAMAKFTEREWRRVAVRFAGPPSAYLALGLACGDHHLVVELDDLALPLPITEAGLAVIDRYEREWPHVAPLPGDLETLGAEAVGVRYALLDRLEAENSPPAELFHILPWDRVRAFIDEVIAALDHGAPASTRELRHWFTVTGSAFTAALEQLNAGLADNDPALQREAATALCADLLELDVDRVSGEVRDGLAEVVRRAANQDPFLRFTADRVTGRLRGALDTGAPVTGPLVSTLPAAAAGPGDRERGERFVVDPFTIDVIVTSEGIVEVVVDADPPAEAIDRVAQVYGALLVAFAVDGETGRTVYLMPVPATSSGIGGILKIRPPSGRFRIRFPWPALGLVEALDFDDEVLARSVAAADRAGMRAWRRLAEQAPPDHPLAKAVARRSGPR